MVTLIFKDKKKITDKKFFCIFFLYIKTLSGCYKKKKIIISWKACERSQNLSEEEKNKKFQYACKRFRNLSEEEKEKKC